MLLSACSLAICVSSHMTHTLQDDSSSIHLCERLCSCTCCPEQERLLQGGLPQLREDSTDAGVARGHLSQQQDDWAPGRQLPRLGNPLGRLPEGHPAVVQPCMIQTSEVWVLGSA